MNQDYVILNILETMLPFPRCHVVQLQSVASSVKRHLHRRDLPTIHQLRKFVFSNIESEINDILSVERKFLMRGRKLPNDLISLKKLCIILRRQNVYQLELQKTRSQLVEWIEGTDERKKKKDAMEMKIAQMKETDSRIFFVHREMDNFEKFFTRLQFHVLYHVFSLPNNLEANTPTKEFDHMLQSYVFENIGDDHIELGHQYRVLKYSNSSYYHLLNEAANVEIALQNYVSDIMSEGLNFKPFCNPDMCHDYLLKGIYVNDFENEGFVLEDNIHRLVGGGSLASFCAYKAGTSVHRKFLPEKFFSCGRRYVPPSDTTDRGLYSVTQRLNIQAVVATSTEEEIHSEYEKMLEWLISLYVNLNLNFRVCNKRASSLHLGESLRTSIQLYSAHRKEFIDAAHISYLSDFVSQRIRILNHDKDENYFTTWLLDINVLSVPLVLASILERSKDKFLVPECLLPYMFSIPSIRSQSRLAKID